MKCEFCDNDANVHLKQVLDGESLEMHLCEKCAEERGITDPAGFALPNLLGEGEDKVALPEFKDLPGCGECGFSLRDLKNVGRLGCPKCYKAFSDEILGMLGTMHRGVKHKGKRPEGMFVVVEQKEALAKVKERLQKAIVEEDFEQAAKLRDEIETLKNEGGVK